MPRLADSIHLDPMDELELGQLGVPVPESPMSIPRAIEFYEYIGQQIAVQGDIASQPIDAVDKGSLTELRKAQLVADGLAAFRVRFIADFAVDYMRHKLDITKPTE